MQTFLPFADIDRVYTNRRRAAFHSFAADELAAYVHHLIVTVTGS